MLEDGGGWRKEWRRCALDLIEISGVLYDIAICERWIFDGARRLFGMIKMAIISWAVRSGRV